MSKFTIQQLLEAGVHYGHHTRRWNPKMAPYIFGVRNNIHIIDLEQTMGFLERALVAIRDVVSSGGRVLYVGTKTQASERVKEAAIRAGQYYINHRWLGGTLTNWKTVNQSIKRMKEMDKQLSTPGRMTKKEILTMQRAYNKIDLALGGIREMGGLPNILFVVDTNKEALAVQEANRLGIPVVAILDSNSSPDGIDYPIPGNDDAMRSIELYCDLVTGAVLEGLQKEMVAAGVDIGAATHIDNV